MLKFVILSLALGWSAQAGVPGGRNPADVNSKDVQEIAGFAVTKLNAVPERNSAVTVSKVVKAERQVVAGINYYLDIEVSQSGCSQDCKKEICAVTVFDQEWTNTRTLTHFKCHEAKTAREVLVGGSIAVSPDSIEVKNAAMSAVTLMNAKSNSLFASSLINVKSATSQVVAGVLYRLEVVIGQTTCRNKPAIDLTMCAVADNSKPKTCQVTILWQAWSTPKYTLQKFDC